MPKEARTVTVAAGQMRATTLRQAGEALAAIERLVRKAARAHADLLVLPECAYPAYFIGSVEAYRSADVMRPRQFLKWLRDLARQYGLWLVCGFVDDQDGRLSSAAALIRPTGRVGGIYRKTFLWHHDLEWYQPGDRIKTFRTDFGRVGMMICADARAPEIAATLCHRGAELIAVPACWVRPRDRFRDARFDGPEVREALAQKERERERRMREEVEAYLARRELPPRPEPEPEPEEQPFDETFRNPQPEFLIAARAREFGVPFVCANKFGSDNTEFGYCGQSLIVRSDGTLAAQAGEEGETLLLAELAVQPPGSQPPALERERTRARSPRLVRRALARVLSPDPPVRPKPKPNDQIVLAAVPTGLLTAALLCREEKDPVAFLVGSAFPQGVLPEGPRLLAIDLRGFGAQWSWLRKEIQEQDVVVIDDDRDPDPEAGIPAIAWVQGRQEPNFLPVRARALQGVPIVVTARAPEDWPLLRARALENRVFVVALCENENSVCESSAAIIAPDGTVLDRVTQRSGRVPCRPALAAIHPSEAADKTVAPQTDIWQQRRVELYAFE